MMTSNGPDAVKSIGDIEKVTVEAVSTGTRGLDSSSEEHLVTWTESDPENPLNWSQPCKWAITILMSLGGMVALMSGTMLAPALIDISQNLHTGPAETNMTLSIFLLAIAFGPMVLAPCTELYGRRRIWLICSTWYVMWSVGCGFAKTSGFLVAGRLLSGLGASVEYAVTTPVLSDCWSPEQRGQSFAISTFIPLLGPALGPILSGVITQSIGWRWLFWVLAVFDGCLVVAAFFILPETYERILLRRRASQLRKETGKPFRTQWEQTSQPLYHELRTSIMRPCWMLVTQPTIQLMSVFLAYNFGALFFVHASFASLWIDYYHQPASVSGLHYIAMVIGTTIGSQVGGRVTDRLWKHYTGKAGGQTAPEYRVPLMIPGAILIPLGLVWFGWAAQSRAHWIVVDIGVAVFGCGIILSTQAMQQYVMESYRDYVASASAASQFLRSIFAFCFPLFAPSLYSRLGLGWGNTLLASVFLVLGIPAPVILWKYGARLRAKGKPMSRL